MAESHTLVFFTAQWCAPAVPMITIFEETIRDLTRLHPELELTGVVVDLDEEETNQQLNAAPPTVSAELLESIDFVPIMVLLRGRCSEWARGYAARRPATEACDPSPACRRARGEIVSAHRLPRSALTLTPSVTGPPVHRIIGSICPFTAHRHVAVANLDNSSLTCQEMPHNSVVTQA